MRAAMARNCVLALVAIAMLALVSLLPEARLPVTCWLLSVAVIWRPSPGAQP